MNALFEVPNLGPQIERIAEQFDYDFLFHRFVRAIEGLEATEDLDAFVDEEIDIRWGIDQFNFEGIDINVFPPQFVEVFDEPIHAVVAFTALIGVVMLDNDNRAVQFLHRNPNLLEEIERFIDQNVETITDPALLQDFSEQPGLLELVGARVGNLDLSFVPEHMVIHGSENPGMDFLQYLWDIYTANNLDPDAVRDRFRQPEHWDIAVVLNQFRELNEGRVLNFDFYMFLVDIYDIAEEARNSRLAAAAKIAAQDTESMHQDHVSSSSPIEDGDAQLAPLEELKRLLDEYDRRHPPRNGS